MLCAIMLAGREQTTIIKSDGAAATESKQASKHPMEPVVTYNLSRPGWTELHSHSSASARLLYVERKKTTTCHRNVDYLVSHHRS